MQPAASSILIVRPSALGDVARSVPVLASLRAAYPAARIDWLVRDSFAPIIAAHPGLSNVVPFPRKELSKWIRTFRWGKVREYFGSLRVPKYDLVFDCQGLARSALLARATGAKMRVGLRDARELGWLPLTHRVKTPRVIHTVDKMLALLEAVQIPVLKTADASRLYTSAADRAWLATESFAKHRYVVIAPTSAWLAKEWPAERFAEVAKHVASRGVAVLVVGGPSERGRIGPLIELSRRNPMVIDRVGLTTVGQLMAVIEGSIGVLSNDSASLHIGVGFFRPVVALFGPTDMRLAAPYGRTAVVLQHVKDGDEFYFRDDRSSGMIRRIEVGEVLEAVEKWL